MASEQHSGGEKGGTAGTAAGGPTHETSNSAFQLFPEPSFQSLSSYGKAVAETGLRFRRRVFARATVESEVSDMVMRSKNKMKRSLNWWDLTWLSIGAVVGAGIFVVTGLQASTVVGPALILSFVVAGVSSMLSVFCYTEFAIEVPVAGGSFAYLRVELGDFIAFITAGNIITEYVIGAAAVARAWTSYFATLMNTQPDKLRIHVNALADNYNELDPLAVGVIWVTGLIAIYSTKATSIANWIASAVSVLIITFVIITGFIKGDPANFTPFLPFGVRGIFEASAVVYFAYLGFDAVATMAEETKNPSRDIPIGLLGSMTFVTIIYCLMAAVLSLLQPYYLINHDAPFSFAFKAVGLSWAQYLVALGALKGMTTVLLVSSVSQARYVTHIARTHMIPPWFAHVNSKTQTPIRATLVMLSMTCVVAFFTELKVLSALLSVSTLTIFTLVAIALLVRRYYVAGETPRPVRNLLILHILLILASSIALGAYWGLSGDKGWKGWIGYPIAGGAWFLATLSLSLFLHQSQKPKVWGVPLMPWIPSASIIVNCFLLGSLERSAFVRFGFVTIVILAYYFTFGLHASYDAATNEEYRSTLHSAISPGEVVSPESKEGFQKLQTSPEPGYGIAKETV